MYIKLLFFPSEFNENKFVVLHKILLRSSAAALGRSLRRNKGPVAFLLKSVQKNHHKAGDTSRITELAIKSQMPVVRVGKELKLGSLTADAAGRVGGIGKNFVQTINCAFLNGAHDGNHRAVKGEVNDEVLGHS